MTSQEIKQWFIDNKKIYFSSIELTENCNFKCKHCYCTDKYEKPLPLNSLKIIIDKIYDTGCLFLTFTGGEILTYPFFKEIYVYAKEKGFIIDLMTNGSLIDTELISILTKMPPRNILITIYGTNEEEYFKFTGNGNNFNKVMNNLTLLRKYNIKFALRTIATKTFYNSLKDGKFDDIAKQFNVPFRYDPIIFPKISGEKSPLNECLNCLDIVELEKENTLRNLSWREIILKDEPFNWHCNAGVNSLAVDYKGDAFVCGLYRQDPISILNNDINQVLLHLKKIHEEHIQIIKSNKCSLCDLRNICKWCPAYSYIYNNNLTEKIEFFCDLSRARVKAFE